MINVFITIIACKLTPLFQPSLSLILSYHSHSHSLSLSLCACLSSVKRSANCVCSVGRVVHTYRTHASGEHEHNNRRFALNASICRFSPDCFKPAAWIPTHVRTFGRIPRASTRAAAAWLMVVPKTRNNCYCYHIRTVCSSALSDARIDSVGNCERTRSYADVGKLN
jgi:hypothetical protein